ncbi:type II toxin-antitoxin system prevent-host-death family antitoxin [Pistricoccus aurantiacus]|uniref:Antitoxin n=1 Tax=Pistricoccus aurantiacus TaxID=1883414 RepID=A0A5B8SU13_9GAMM|nr:type II toxin-antitoxin system prevent-host-death family antitoxin [Pistricoccus aurantiacus]QEA38258.1 type II toxin-antitoxin system prevent-host-death family antitoxin [Pistricoccus aurantiacus]
MEWQLQLAKSKLSELVETTSREGPQVITVRGKRKVVMISAEEYDALVQRNSQGSLVEFLRASPLAEVELDLERSHDEGREVAL